MDFKQDWVEEKLGGAWALALVRTEALLYEVSLLLMLQGMYSF